MDDQLEFLKGQVENAFTELFAYNRCAAEETLIVIEDLEESLRDMKYSLYDEMDMVYDR